MDEFKNSEDLKVWLVSKGLPASMAQNAAGDLFAAGFIFPGTLEGIAAADLRPPLTVPVSMMVSNALKAAALNQGIPQSGLVWYGPVCVFVRFCSRPYSPIPLNYHICILGTNERTI